MCVLGSDGELNVATSLVDDEGVDLVFYRSARGPTLSVQVKSHFLDAGSAGSSVPTPSALSCVTCSTGS